MSVLPGTVPGPDEEVEEILKGGPPGGTAEIKDRDRLQHAEERIAALEALVRQQGEALQRMQARGATASDAPPDQLRMSPPAAPLGAPPQREGAPTLAAPIASLGLKINPVGRWTLEGQGILRFNVLAGGDRNRYTLHQITVQHHVLEITRTQANQLLVTGSAGKGFHQSNECCGFGGANEDSISLCASSMAPVTILGDTQFLVANIFSDSVELSNVLFEIKDETTLTFRDDRQVAESVMPDARIIKGQTWVYRRSKEEVEALALADRLVAFYHVHNPAKVTTAADVARKFVGKESQLNEKLLETYNADLTSIPA